MLHKKVFAMKYLILLAISFMPLTLFFLHADSWFDQLGQIPSTIFPVLTILLLVFHFQIAIFMLMKYICDKSRLYLVPISLAFSGSVLLMIGTLSSFPGYSVFYDNDVVRYNDVAIFYFFRNILMSGMFLISGVLFTQRKKVFSFRNVNFINFSLVLSTIMVVFFAWLFSGYSDIASLSFFNERNKEYTHLWTWPGGFLVLGFWIISTAVIISSSRLKNIFWISILSLCICYIEAFYIVMNGQQSSEFLWDLTRLFEVLATLVIIIVLLYDIFHLYKLSESHRIRSQKEALIDPLTGLSNRAGLNLAIEQIDKNTKKDGYISVLLGDLDHFKYINDTFGHPTGDVVLQNCAQVIEKCVRNKDVVARFGGEEFIILLEDTSSSYAVSIAERIRMQIKKEIPEKLPFLNNHVSISIGVTSTRYANFSADSEIKKADQAMYSAKENGRDQVFCYVSESDE